jgi:hypothetical protein
VSDFAIRAAVSVNRNRPSKLGLMKAAASRAHSKWAMPNGAISHGMSIKALETADGKISLLL